MTLTTVLSLGDKTGVMVRDWAAYGYDCWCVDIQHPRGVTKRDGIHWVGADVHELYRGHMWLPDSADFAFAFPPCTYFTASGNRWQDHRGPGCVGRGLVLTDAFWRLLISYGCPWGMENPAVGRLASSWRKPDHAFHPFEYAGYLPDPEAENTMKKTGIWCGRGFIMPEKRPANPPHRTDCHDMAPGPDRPDERSKTPVGFARAVFLANATHLRKEDAA